MTTKTVYVTGVSGVITPALLGTGTGAATKFLRGDGTWQTVAADTGVTALVGGKVNIADLNEWVSEPITSWSSIPARASLIPPGFTGRLVLDCGQVGPRTLAGDAAVRAVLLDGDEVSWPVTAPVA